MHIARIQFLAGAIVILAQQGSAQTDWSMAPLFTPRAGLAACYDVGRDVTVFFGGRDAGRLLAEVWEWQGSSLIRRVTVGGPSARAGHALAFDRVRQRAVLFGGRDAGGERSDTWLFDGQTWTVGPGAGPAARQEHAMTWDPASARVLLVGGRTHQLRRGDTWAFDGAAWTNLAAPVVPRSAAMLATPAGTGSAPLLFGGRDQTGLRADLLRWSGAAWLAVATPTAPPAREGAVFVSDGSAGGMLLAAGLDAAGARSDAWRFDGAQWTSLVLPGLPARGLAGAAYDAGGQRVLLAGGIASGQRRQNDVVALPNGSSTWTTVRAPDSPPARSSHAAAFDATRQRTVLFGGVTNAGQELGDTWEWDGTSWQPRPVFGPAPRAFHGLAWLPNRQSTLLFGGRAAGSPLGDTWEWDGSGWNPLTPVAAPSPRQAHALATTRNGGALLYGGTDALFQVRSDTWRFDGTTWSQLPAFGPGPRRGHALCFDAANDEVVLFGGHDGSGPRGDTWVFEQSGWVLRPTTIAPTPRLDAAMTFAPERRRVVLHGGLDAAFRALGDTWEWDGNLRTWQQSSVPTPPGPRFLAALAHHAATDRTVLLGGTDGSRDRADTLRYGAAATARVEPFGVACPVPPVGITIAPAPFSRPWLGDTFDLVISGLPSQPGFGFVVYGFSRTSWNALPLPAPLDPYGLTGCLLYISADEPFPLFHTGLEATFSFPIPLAPSFAGFRFYNQVIVFDPGLPNPAGAAVSGAVTATVGLR